METDAREREPGTHWKEVAVVETRGSGTAGSAKGLRAGEELVRVETDSVSLEAKLAVPEGASGIVAFAHGSGSSRHSPRNNFVAETLRDGGLATLLLDLLTEKEDEVDLRTREHRFDIDLLTNRVVGTVEWLRAHPGTGELRVGLFGSSTGAAAALRAAAERPNDVAAVVSRGGRVDLAGEALRGVRAPTLMIVGERDRDVLSLNREARESLAGPAEVRIVEGAGHLFEGPGELQEVAGMARDWFREHLGAA